MEAFPVAIYVTLKSVSASSFKMDKALVITYGYTSKLTQLWKMLTAGGLPANLKRV